MYLSEPRTAAARASPSNTFTVGSTGIAKPAPVFDARGSSIAASTPSASSLLSAVRARCARSNSSVHLFVRTCQVRTHASSLLSAVEQIYHIWHII